MLERLRALVRVRHHGQEHQPDVARGVIVPVPPRLAVLAPARAVDVFVGRLLRLPTLFTRASLQLVVVGWVGKGALAAALAGVMFV